MIAAALTFGAVWCALAVVVGAVYARAARNRKRWLATYNARVRYSTEALTEARLRVARRHNADLWQPMDGAA